MASLAFRRADADDAWFLFQLRTDPVTAAMSPGPPPSWETHCAWLTHTLEDATRELWIVEHAALPVATARVDRGPDQTAVVSITVAPEHRRQGVGMAVLAFLTQSYPDVTLVAEIRPENLASRRLFVRSGYVPIMMRYERRSG